MGDPETARRSTVAVLTMAAVLIAAAADGQVRVTTWTPVQEGPAVTAVLGRAATEMQPRDRSFDLATRFDVPLGDRFLGRLEAGTVRWNAQQAEFLDRVSMTRVMVSIVRRERQPAFTHVRFYGGVGVGAYYFDSEGLSRRGWRGGLHLLAGFEVPLPESRVTIVGEAQLHATGIPRRFIPASPILLGTASASLGLKFRM